MTLKHQKFNNQTVMNLREITDSITGNFFDSISNLATLLTMDSKSKINTKRKEK